MIDYLRLKYNMDYIKESLDILLESYDEGKLRYTVSNKTGKSYANNVNPQKLIIVRAVDKLNKEKKNMSPEEYKRKLDKLDKVAKRIDKNFDYVSNSDHGNAFDKIEDTRKLANRHTRKRTGEKAVQKKPDYGRLGDLSNKFYSSKSDEEEKRAKRLAKRLLSSDNVYGINKSSQGMHDNTFKQLAKQTGFNKDDPIRIDREDPKGTDRLIISNKTQSNKANQKVNIKGKLFRVSSSKNAKYARPSNKSSDNVIYPNARIYYADSMKAASGSAPSGKAQHGYVADTKGKSKDVYLDPEVASNHAYYSKSRFKEPVKKDDEEAKKTNKENKEMVNSILGNFASMLKSSK